MEGEEKDQHGGMMGIHPYPFQKLSTQGKETVLRRLEREKSVHSYMQSISEHDVSLYGGITPRRSLDLELMRDNMPIDSPLMDSRGVKTLFPYPTLFRSMDLLLM